MKKTVDSKGIFVDSQSSRFFFFFFSKYYIAYLLFILSFKNCVSIGMELKMNLESLKPLGYGRRVPAEVNCKPCVMYARPCLCQENMMAR